MSKPNDIDTLIRDALSEEEAAFYDRLGEPSVHDLVTSIFTGRNRWLTWLGVAGTLVCMVLMIVSISRYFETSDLAERITWAGVFFLSTLAVLAGKIWYWMEMQRNMLTREIKRVELQVVHLASELRRRPLDG